MIYQTKRVCAGQTTQKDRESECDDDNDMKDGKVSYTMGDVGD